MPPALPSLAKTELSAVGVHWKVALESEIVFAQKAHALALGAKAHVLQRQQRTVMV